MLKNCLPVLILATLGATAITRILAQDSGDKPPIQATAGKGSNQDQAAQISGQDVFGLTRMHKFHLEFSPDEWEAMQAVVGRGPFGGGPGRGPQPGGRRPGVQDENRPPEKSEASDATQGESAPATSEEKRPPELHKSAGFGTEFPWAHAKLQAFGQTFDDVGVRYKGNGSYMGSSGSLKRNLKIDLDRYFEGGQFQGIKALNLNAGGVDPTRLREALGFEVFRASGVPAPRTAFAELTLTVPGKYDHELVGMYTLIEQIDKVFLKDRFQDAGGVLMKPERLREFAYLGDDWDRYAGQYQPKHKPSKKQARQVIDFLRLLDKSNDEKFQAEIGNYLDLDEFLRFLATSAWLSNMDSLFAIGHNFYIYLDPKTNKLNFLPWDLDLSFAGFPMMGSPDDLLNLNLKHPHAGSNKLIDRLLAVPEIARRYEGLLAELTASSFAKDRLLAEIAELESATQDSRAREQAAVEARNEKRRTGPFGGGPGGMGRSPSLTAFVEKRVELVSAQLAGTNPGYTPRGGFGPGGRGGPGRFGPGNFMARPLLEALDTNKDGKLTKNELVTATTKFFADSDPEHSGKLDEAAIAAAIERIMPRPPNFGPPGFGRPGAGPPGSGPPDIGPPGLRPPAREASGDRPPAAPDERPENGPPPAEAADRRPADNRPFGGPGERPQGFSPAAPLAAALLKRADANHDDQVTLDETVAAAESLFAEADNDKKAELDEGKLATAINGLFPRPPGFGPPGFGPPGNGPRDNGPQGNRPGFGRPGFDRPNPGGRGERSQRPPGDAKPETQAAEPQP